MATRKPAAKTATTKSSAKVDDRYFAEQSPEKRALLEKMRSVVRKALPDADVSIKWGVPFYQRNGKNVCSLAAFKENVAITFFAPPSALADPKKKLEGSGKTMRMYKVRSASDIDAPAIQRWVKAAAGSE
jgi:hypothetical protein